MIDRKLVFLALLTASIILVSIGCDIIVIRISENKIDELEQEIIELKEEVDIHTTSIGIMVEMWETQNEFNKIVVDIFG